MARYKFGDGIADFVIVPPSTSPSVSLTSGGFVGGVVIAAAGAIGQVYDTAGATPLADLLAEDGVTPITEIATDSDGFIVPFYADDERVAVAVTFDAGVSFVVLVSAEALTAAVALAPAVAQAQADAAEALSRVEVRIWPVIGPSDPTPVGAVAGDLIPRRQA